MESILYSIVLQDMSRLYTYLMPTSAEYLLIFKLGKDRKLTLLKRAIIYPVNASLLFQLLAPDIIQN